MGIKNSDYFASGDENLPESGRNFRRLDVLDIGRTMLAQGKRVHSFALKGRPFRCEEPINIHFIANNKDVVDCLRDDERLDLSHYDESLEKRGGGATFFITAKKDVLENQWRIFEAALNLPPVIQRFVDNESADNDVYDLIEEQAEMAVQEAIVEIYKRRDKPSLLEKTRRLFGPHKRSNEVDIIREYGIVVTHLFVKDFLGLNIPGRSLYHKSQKFYSWIAIMFANLFVNPGGRDAPINVLSTIVSKMYRRRILKSYKNPKKGTLLHRLKIIGEDKTFLKGLTDIDTAYEDYVVNIIMEVAGSFQFLTGSSFASIIKSIDEKEPRGFGRNELPALIKKISADPRAWIDEYLRHNSPTDFIFRTAKRGFVLGEADILPGDLLCLVTGEASKDQDVFGSESGLQSPKKSKELCPYHTHFGSPDTEPNNGRPTEPHHPCFGQYWGRTILQNMLEGLLYFRWLQAAEGAKFKKEKIFFPSFKMVFAKETKTQQFLTVMTEIPKGFGKPEDAEIFLESLGHKTGNVYRELGLPGEVHFMSGHVIRGRQNLAPKLPFNLRLPFGAEEEPDYLVLELSVDGNMESFLRHAPPKFYNLMADLYHKAGITEERASVEVIRRRLFDDHFVLEQSVWPTFFNGKTTNGLPFSGTLGLNSYRIKAEHEVAIQAERLLEEGGHEKETPHGRLYHVRKALRKKIIESGDPNWKSIGWVLGGSEAPFFSETQNDPWVKRNLDEKLGPVEYASLAWKLLPRILLVPIAVLFGLVAANFYESPDDVVYQFGLYEISSAKSFAYLMAAILLAAFIGMLGRWAGGSVARKFDVVGLLVSFWNKLVGRELGEMFVVSAFYLVFLVFFNSWSINPKENSKFNFWDYPGLGPIPDGMFFPITLVLICVIVSLVYFRQLSNANEKAHFGSKPQARAFGLFILLLVVSANLYLHLFWMFPGYPSTFDDFLVSNRFVSGQLMDHLFYPLIHASVIVLTFHAFRKSFHNPSCPLASRMNFWLLTGVGFAIWVCALLPIESRTALYSFLRDVGVFAFLIPAVTALILLVIIRILNPAISIKDGKRSHFLREWILWSVLAAILVNFNRNIRDLWGRLWDIEPLTGEELDPYMSQVITVSKAFVIAFPMSILLALIFVLFIKKFILNSSEVYNTPHDSDPSIENMKNMMYRENAEGSVQNHMVSVQRLLPEWFRIRVLLPLSYQVIQRMLTTGIIRPGFLGNVGTVHFARWIHLPRTRNYAFFSNYDGSFESYLEDFVTKVNAGLNAAWSHCIGFPKVKNIFTDGTKDGDRFKRWARGSTRPTPFWYSAYPNLSVEVIRRNALIRDGLVRARSASEAEAWLDLFNSTTRPEHALQTDQIQSFVFGGASHLPSGCCLILQSHTTGRYDVSDLRSFLKEIEGKITFGQNKPKERAIYLAISNEGVRHLLPQTAEERNAQPWKGDQPLDSVFDTDPTWFSSPFVIGMDNDERSRVLGDFDEEGNNRSNWEWGSYENRQKSDLGVLLIYAASDALRDEIVAEVHEYLEASALSFHKVDFQTHEIEDDCPDKKEMSEKDRSLLRRSKPIKEPFGFVDGVSNPVIQGTTRAAKNPSSIHLVNPGEFILGYRDNRGFFPPSPQVSANEDIHRLLPALPNLQPQKYPTFGQRDTDDLRDLGRNGSYLVIRQLEQNVDLFEADTRKCAKKVLADLNNEAVETFEADEVNLTTMTSIVRAKMMGRWQDGQSLVTRPAYVNEFYNTFGLEDPTKPENEMTKKFLHEDNEFLFGRDDPQGYACPLGSHIRRANPRDSLDANSQKELEVSNRHRLLRRGRTYEDNDRDTEGLFFMCLNADIERQFEFVQQTWINGRNFHGLRNEYDPISTKSGQFTIQCPGLNPMLSLDQFVTVRGGGYFFMPSKDALMFLVENNEKVSQTKDDDVPHLGRAYVDFRIME